MTQKTRRQFIQQSLTASGSLLLAFSLPIKGRASQQDTSTTQSVSHHYFEIFPDNRFIFTMDKAEMGQGVINGQVTLFGEESEIHPSRFDVVTASVKDEYAPPMPMMITGGSSSTPTRWELLRQLGANLKQLMLDAAAQKWGVDQDQLQVNNGVVSNQSGDQVSYGELINIASTLTLPETAPLKSPESFKYIGKWNGSVDAKDKSTGTDQFGIDFSIDNMLIAVVERCPTLGGKLKSFDASEALKLPGVKNVFEISAGVAIVCEKYWQAKKARSAVKITWDPGKNESLSSAQIADSYRELMAEKSGHEMQNEGDVTAAFSSADQLLEVEYSTPYLAHATMEPMNACAWVQDDECDIWVATQSPTSVRNEAARILRTNRDKVKVHNSKYLGGGFGRRATLEYPIEAVEISKLAKAPVKVIWSREDDTRFSPMRPLNVHQFKAAIKDGDVSAWQHKIGCESLMQQFFGNIAGSIMPNWLPDGLGGLAGSIVRGGMELSNAAPTVAEGAETPYDISNKRIEHYNLGIDIPIHFWRSVGHSYNGFVVESFVDEVAHASGQDPYIFRRDKLPKESRLKGVLDLVTDKAGWDTPLEKSNRFRGIAAHESFNSFVAQIAEVDIIGSSIHVKKVSCAVDCGVAINPENIKKQMQSGIIYGLSAALHGEITLENGAVAQANFDTYPPLRMSETPEIEVFILPSKASPTGVGEPGLPPIAAAVGNAVFAATGQRLRKLPFSLS